MRCERYIDGVSCGLPAHWYCEGEALCEDCCLAALRSGDPACAADDYGPVAVGESGEIERCA